jgi:hypothetical protein
MFQALFSAVTLLVIAGLVDLGYAAPKVNIGGYIRNETAVRIRDQHEVLWSENIFQIDTDVELIPDRFYLYFSGRLFYDAVYDLQDYGFLGEHKDRKVLRDNMAGPQHDSLSDYIREFYVDMYVGDFDIRLGKQQIVWGETDLFQMLDIINPMDIRRFNQHSWEEIRISLWGARIDWNPTLNTSLQFVLIPDVEPMFVPPFGTTHPYLPKALRVLPPLAFEEHEVGKSLSNMEWGVRWYQTFGAFNYTLNYFRHWSDGPGLYVDMLDLTAHLKYKRVHSIGGSFAWNFTKFLGMKSVVIRFEGVVNLDDIASAMNYDNPLGAGTPETVRSNNFQYVLALDKTFYGMRTLFPSGLTCMFHIYQTYLLDYEHDHKKRHFLVGQTNADADEVETMFAVIMQSTYLPGEYLVPTLAVVYKEDGAWEIMPSISYQWNDHISTVLAATIWSGDNDDLLGEFQKSSNVSFRIKYGF